MQNSSSFRKAGGEKNGFRKAGGKGRAEEGRFSFLKANRPGKGINGARNFYGSGSSAWNKGEDFLLFFFLRERFRRKKRCGGTKGITKKPQTGQEGRKQQEKMGICQGRLNWEQLEKDKAQLVHTGNLLLP